MNSIKYYVKMIALLIACNANAMPENFIESQAVKVKDKVIQSIEERMSELNTQLPNPTIKTFSKGTLSFGDDGLTWTKKDNTEVTLVKYTDLPEGHGLSNYLVSPDDKKIAFSTAYKRQDLEHWNIVTIEEEPKIMWEEPVQNRQDGVSWNSTSDGFFYSYSYEKTLVELGLKPIVENRFKNLKGDLDKTIFNHGLAENFNIVDLNGGNTLLAYRLLADLVGIETSYSMFKGSLQSNGTYKWETVYPKNKYVGLYVGTYNKKVYFFDNSKSDTYSLLSIDLFNNNKIETVIAGKKNWVLHKTDMVRNYVILHYHSDIEQNVQLQVFDLKRNKIVKNFDLKTIGLTPYGGLLKFNFHQSGVLSRSIFFDVNLGNQVVELDLSKLELTHVKSDSELNFDPSQMKSELFKFTASDGRLISGRLFTRKDSQPSFAFLRHYGWISVKSYPEAKEVQAIVELGGAYMTLDLPGGGERGAQWFIDGTRNRQQSIKYISEASSFIQNKLSLSKDKIVAMGRSWGGLTSLVLAATYGHNFGIINSVAPIVDLKLFFEQGYFGRIAHSDLLPNIDENGDYILDDSFWNYVANINPVNLYKNIPKDLSLNIFSSELDDIVDQSEKIEPNFAYLLSKHLPERNFHYHQAKGVSHGSRYYQPMMLSLIARKYNLEIQPLVKD